MERKLLVVIALLGMCLLAPNTARAQWSDGFEAYNAGDIIQGKGDFIYWTNTEDVNSHAFVSDVVAYNSEKSLMIGGHAGAHYTDPVWQFADVVTGVSPVSAGLWVRWVQSQMVYIPATSIKEGGGYVDFNYMSRHQSPPAPNLDWGGGNPRFNLVTGKITGTGVTEDISIVPDQWIEFRLEVDFDALYDHDDNPNTDPRVLAEYYYDGTIISTYAWDDDPVQLAGVDFWAPAEAGPVYIDDVSLAPAGPPDPTALTGDTDGNGIVDAADYIAVKTNMGKSSGVALATGDVNEDGRVDWTDLQLLQENYGKTLAGAANATPEPATLGLLAFGALAMLRRRRHRFGSNAANRSGSVSGTSYSR